MLKAVPSVDICSLEMLSGSIQGAQPDVVVSAVPVNLTNGWFRHVRVPIDDIYNAELKAYKDAIRAVLACDGDRILVHCEQGKSRCAALAIAKIYQHDPSGVGVFLDHHPEAEPNPLLLLLADEILGAGGDLLRRCAYRYKGRGL